MSDAPVTAGTDGWASADVAAKRGCPWPCACEPCPCADLADRIANLEAIAGRLSKATGHDRSLDAAIAAEFWYRERMTPADLRNALMEDALQPFTKRRGEPPTVPYLTRDAWAAQDLAVRRAVSIPPDGFRPGGTDREEAVATCAAVVAAQLERLRAEV